MPLASALGEGRLAMADPDAVPAGKYGKAALTALGVWPQVQGKVVRGDSVRAALAFVERGEAPYGIVYETDAAADKGEAESLDAMRALCRPGQDASTCLTADQISALHRIYADYYEADQTYVFGGYYPGGETRYYHGLVGKTQFKIGRAYFQYIVTKYVKLWMCAWRNGS